MSLRERAPRARYDAVVVGAGPNGLAAAVTLARAGWAVLVVEAAPSIGGGTRTAELTLPGFRHDVCSAVHPLGVGSPFFRELDLPRQGLEWVHPPAPLAHPFDDGRAAVLFRSVEDTARGLGEDGGSWTALFEPLARRWDDLAPALLGPLLRVPRHPFAMLGFARSAVRPAAALARSRFRTPQARALFAGLAAHSMVPLERAFTAGFGLVLGALAHAAGWPVARGGSQSIAEALGSLLGTLGGDIVRGTRVGSLDELPPARAVLCDVTPRQLVGLAGDRLGGLYRRRLLRFRHGPGAFKMDFALDGPVPWRAPECALAGTVHLGPTLEEIAAGEAAVWRGETPELSLVLVAQQSLFDPSRAPAGKHTLWAYCHVPHASAVDARERVVRQIERFAPGFRDRILAVSAMGPAQLEAYDENYVGGDIGGGAQDGAQLFARPAWRRVPYATPAPGLYICSSSTPPGGGVHGMCGYLAARAVLESS